MKITSAYRGIKKRRECNIYNKLVVSSKGLPGIVAVKQGLSSYHARALREGVWNTTARDDFKTHSYCVKICVMFQVNGSH